MDRLIIFMASAGYAGFFPRAPGTVGTGVGVLAFLLFSPFPPHLYLLTLAALVTLSAWVSGRAEVLLGRKDSPIIAIDEATGYLITMALLPCTAAAIVFGFLFFRVFDIMKPPPADWINSRMKGGWAVVLDDAVAGGYANMVLRLAAFFYPDFFFLLG